MRINDEAIKNYITAHPNKMELAYKLGLSLTTLIYIMQGKRKPGRKVLMAFINHGIPIDQLLTEQEEELPITKEG